MSDTFNLVSHASRKRVWIGQGSLSMTNFYAGDSDVMSELKRFLNDTRGEALYFVSDTHDDDGHFDYEDYSHNDNEQISTVPSEELTTGPKPGETWRRHVQHSSDEDFNFALMARDYAQTKWFVFHRCSDGEGFVISKDGFFADRANWKCVCGYLGSDM